MSSCSSWGSNSIQTSPNWPWPPGLLLVTAVGLERLANLLAVGDAGGAELDLDAELALELAAQHVQVDVAGAGDDHLLGLGRCS